MEIKYRGHCSTRIFTEKIKYGTFHSMKNQLTRKSMIGIGLKSHKIRTKVADYSFTVKSGHRYKSSSSEFTKNFTTNWTSTFGEKKLIHYKFKTVKKFKSKLIHPLKYGCCVFLLMCSMFFEKFLDDKFS